jgi:hypothetical protein
VGTYNVDLLKHALEGGIALGNISSELDGRATGRTARAVIGAANTAITTYGDWVFIKCGSTAQAAGFCSRVTQVLRAAGVPADRITARAGSFAERRGLSRQVASIIVDVCNIHDAVHDESRGVWLRVEPIATVTL